MLSKQDKAKIIALGKRYRARRILLFGSSAEPETKARDIDLAVEGVPSSRFFELYGELMLTLTKPVDLVDLGRKSKFTAMIREEGLSLYG